MLRLMVLSISLGYVLCLKPSHEAAILSESRYLNTAGQFGSAYVQEDGVEFNEEADSEGNRKGWYSYKGQDGIRRTVSYTAGKDGFIASGDHLPVPPPANGFPTPAPKISAPAPGVAYQQFQSMARAENQPAPPPLPPSSSVQQSNAAAAAAPPAVQLQFQSIPVPDADQLINLFQTQPIRIVTSTQIPLIPHPTARLYPPGKLNVQQTADGFSYTFKSLL